MTELRSPHRPSVYFGGCDRQMEGYLSYDEFKDSFVMNMLFHGDLAIPDIYFYISSHLAKLIQNDPKFAAFVAEGTRDGAIIPYFRSECGQSFRNNLSEIRGVPIQGLHDRADEIARFFDESVFGRSLNYRLWPDAPVSKGYRDILDAGIFSNEVELGDGQLINYWEATRKMRDVIRSELKPDNLGGYTRGSVQNAVYKFATGKFAKIDDIRDIWRELTDMTMKENIQRFLKWSNYCYHYNQANKFALAPGLVELEEIDITFVDRIIAKRRVDDISDPYTGVFSIPSATDMLNINAKKLYEIRNDPEIGGKYFVSLRRWQNLPSKYSAETLLENLEKYIANIRVEYLKNVAMNAHPLSYFRASIPSGPMRWAGIIGSAAKISINAKIGALVPGWAYRSLVSKTATAFYQILGPKLREFFESSLGRHEQLQIEVDEITRVNRTGNLNKLASRSDASFPG